MRAGVHMAPHAGTSKGLDMLACLFWHAQVCTWHRMFNREVKLREAMKQLIVAVWGNTSLGVTSGGSLALSVVDPLASAYRMLAGGRQ